jgi:hypothetical protein
MIILTALFSVLTSQSFAVADDAPDPAKIFTGTYISVKMDCGEEKLSPTDVVALEDGDPDTRFGSESIEFLAGNRFRMTSVKGSACHKKARSFDYTLDHYHGIYCGANLVNEGTFTADQEGNLHLEGRHVLVSEGDDITVVLASGTDNTKDLHYRMMGNILILEETADWNNRTCPPEGTISRRYYRHEDAKPSKGNFSS